MTSLSAGALGCCWAETASLFIGLQEVTQA